MLDHQPSRHAWLVVLILFAGSVLNYVDRSVLGVVKPHLQRDLSLNNLQYGLAVNVFLLSYSVLYILGGRLADRYGYRRMFPINIAFWSLACILHSLARGLGSLCLFRGLLGVGEGGYYPSAIRGTSELFGPEERAKPVGVLISGLSVGALITPPIVAWITFHYGWRAAFAATGAAGLLLIPLWELVQRGTASLAPARPQDSRGSLWAILAHRKHLCLLLARAVTDAVWTFYLFWMPGYFQEGRGFDLRAVGMLLWIPFLCADAGALAQPLIGRLVDTSGYSPAFLWAGLTYVAAIAFVAAMGKIEPIEERTA